MLQSPEYRVQYYEKYRYQVPGIWLVYDSLNVSYLYPHNYRSTSNAWMLW